MLFCLDCLKPVSSKKLPDDIIVRAIITCPECFKAREDKIEKLLDLADELRVSDSSCKLT